MQTTGNAEARSAAIDREVAIEVAASRESLKRDIMLEVNPNPIQLDKLVEQLMDEMTLPQLARVLYRARLSNKKRKPTELRGSEGAPVLWKYGKRIWLEDDCTLHDPQHEYLDEAFQRLTGSRYNVENAEAFEDCGDGTIYHFGNWIVCSSFPGNNAIYENGEAIAMLKASGCPAEALDEALYEKGV